MLGAPTALGLLTALTGATPPPHDGAPNEILVDLVDQLGDAEVRALDAAFPKIRLRLNSFQSEDERMYVARLGPSEHADVLRRLRRDARVEAAEPNFIYHLLDDVPAPTDPRGPETQRRLPAEVDDPFFSKQWSFPMIGVPQAWAHADGEGAVVAVIDTGVAFEDYKKFKQVEDLQGTGFVEGYDFISDTSHPNDDHGHGTHVAGTIAQTTNNALGVAGVAPKARIMPLKVLSKRGSGTAGDIADAIRFAADEGANVINMSLGGGPRSVIMEAAIRYARSKGVVVVCAAGNGGRAKVEYPAAYVGAFAVSSVGPDGQLAYYSSYGREVAVAAPGGNKQLGAGAGILQNTITPANVASRDTYLEFQGTSMAAPHVAGVAALVMSAGVTDATAVERILELTALDAGPAGWDERYGSGIVNARRAVEMARAKVAFDARAHARMAAAPPPPPATTPATRVEPRLDEPAVVGLPEVVGADRLTLRLRQTLEGLVLGLAWVMLVLARSGRSTLREAGLRAAAGVVFGVVLAAAPLGLVFRWAPWQSMLPVLAGVLLLLQVKRLRPVMFGLSAGWTMALAVQIPALWSDIAGIPGDAGWLDRLWLLTQTGFGLVLTQRLARLVVRR